MKYRTIYDRQFKVETIKIILESKQLYSQVSEELGIHENTLRRWVKEFEDYGVDAFPGNAVAKKCLEYELEKIKQENSELQMENELFKQLQVFLMGEKKRRAMSSPEHIGIDETSFQKRHEYVMVNLDKDQDAVIDVLYNRR